MSISVYTPDSTKILHTAYADFVSRQIGRTVHVVQYDDSLPLLAVKLFSDGQPYVIPSNADISIKLGKSDGKFVYNPALGCDVERHIAYFEITYQMVVLAEAISPIIEVKIGSSVAASSSIGIIIDRNPIQREDIESTSEWKVIEEAVEYAKEAVTAAANASASAANASVSSSAAAKSEQAAYSYKIEAHNSALAVEGSLRYAATSAANAKASETKAASYEENCELNAKTSRSYAVGDTDYRTGEETDNAKYYYQQAKQISQGFNGLLPMGTITFSDLALQTKHSGYMYNISDEFVSNTTFKDGGNIKYPAGTNIYYTADGYWDCLANSLVAGVKGDAETDYQQGFVNITPDSIGSYDKDSVDNFISGLNSIMNSMISRITELEELSGFAHLVDNSGMELVTSDDDIIILSV